MSWEPSASLPPLEMGFGVLLLSGDFMSKHQRHLRQHEQEGERQYAENLEIDPGVGRQDAPQHSFSPAREKRKSSSARSICAIQRRHVEGRVEDGREQQLVEVERPQQGGTEERVKDRHLQA